MARLYPHNAYKRLLKPLLILLIAAIVVVGVISGIRTTTKAMEETQFDIIKQSIRSALVCCYSIEGRYPRSLAYLEENYGLVVDHEKYVISYEYIASNIMPAFIVVQRGVQ